jgi:hypothetical protein
MKSTDKFIISFYSLSVMFLLYDTEYDIMSYVIDSSTMLATLLGSMEVLNKT